MSKYTDFFKNESYDIFEAEDYNEELKKIAKNFRTFGKALDTFILERGYVGDIDNVEEKVKFITDALKQSGVPIPVNIKNWYLEHTRIKKKTAFQICFGFNLKLEEVDDFLRRICLLRGFDCHSIEEVVYFFAIKKGLSYSKAQEIISRVQIVKPLKVPKEDVIYTEVILEALDDIDSEDELVEFINNNSEMFEYNNATAYDVIRIIWKEISKEDGIALREKIKLYRAFDKEVEVIEDEYTEEKTRKDRKRIDESIWEILLQMLGLSGSYANAFYSERSIKKILIDNEMLHPLAEDSFPDRDGLNKILNGTHISEERVRKLLILLAFYSFWGNRAIKKNSYEAMENDDIRCVSFINSNLMDAGYPTLYPGNPYDFVIFASVNSGMPLVAFREYMRELFFEKIDLEGNIYEESKSITTEY